MRTITVDLPHEDPQCCGAAAFSLPLPLHVKPVTAVEQLRGDFASAKANLPANPRYQILSHTRLHEAGRKHFAPACFAEECMPVSLAETQRTSFFFRACICRQLQHLQMSIAYVCCV